jgi:Ca2+-binding RTX toxin-like protein
VGDTFSGIQNLIGSNSNDSLYGDAQVNILTGGLGTDLMYGYDGDDTFFATAGRDTAYGGNGDDIFHVDVANPANLPALVSGDGASLVGDTIILDNLVSGSYTLSSLASVTNTMEILDIRNTHVSTTLNLTSLDVRNFVDNGNASEIWIKADSGGDSLVMNLAAGETSRTNVMTDHWTDYTIFNSASAQVAQIHWQTA